MSDTNHPRVFGTHRAANISREVYERGTGQTANYGTRARTIEGFRATAQERIAEGLAEIAAPMDMDERWTERECHSEWEALHENDWADPLEPAYMARWEQKIVTPIGLGEPPEGTVWATTTHHARYMASETTAAMVRSLESRPRFDCTDETDDGTEPTDWTTWLQGSVSEAFPDYQFSVEGPAETREPSVRASGYYRVYEAARLLDVNTDLLIRLLRAEGEWVTGAGSYVAKPVIDEWATTTAIRNYGPRTKKTWGEHLGQIHASLRKSEFVLANPA